MLQTRAQHLRSYLGLDPTVPLVVNPREGVPCLYIPDPAPLGIPPGLFRNHEQWQPKTGLEVPMLPDMAGETTQQVQPKLTLRQLMLGRYRL
jgi:hypothetical protein